MKLIIIGVSQQIIAVKFIHEQGYLHRDIKPENLAHGIGEQKRGEPRYDVTLKSRAYLFGQLPQFSLSHLCQNTACLLKFIKNIVHVDMGCAVEYVNADGSHKKREEITLERNQKYHEHSGSIIYMSRDGMAHKYM